MAAKTEKKDQTKAKKSVRFALPEQTAQLNPHLFARIPEPAKQM